MWLLSLGMADDDWDLIKLPPLWVSSVCSSAGMALKSWRSFTSPASPKSSSSNSRGGVRLLPLPTLLRGRPRMLTDLFPRLHAPNDGRSSSRRWCATARPTGSPPMCGRGGSTARNPSKALLILGDTTGVAAQKLASPASRWSAAGRTRPCSSSPTPRSTTTRCPPTATPSPAAPATSSLPLPAEAATLPPAIHPPALRPPPLRRVSPPRPPSRPPWRTNSSRNGHMRRRTRTRRRTKTRESCW